VASVENHLIERLPLRDRRLLLAVCELFVLVPAAVLSEAGKPTRHPIGYGTLASLTASDPIIINSQADWINPGTVNSPTTSCGSGLNPIRRRASA